MKTEREKLIELLVSLGAEDLTKLIHPNKVGKKYFKLYIDKIKYPKTFICFNFDYKEYNEVSVTSRRKNIDGYKTFNEIQLILKELGL